MSLSKKILIGLLALFSMAGLAMTTASASTEKAYTNVQAWECPYDHICFYPAPDGEGDPEIYPWYMDYCVNLEQPAASVYNRTRDRTAVVFVNPDCDGGWGSTPVAPGDRKNLEYASWSFKFLD